MPQHMFGPDPVHENRVLRSLKALRMVRMLFFLIWDEKSLVARLK